MTHSEAGKLGSIKGQVTQQRAKETRIATYLLSPTVCGFCSKALPYENRKDRFCNHSCSSK